MDDLNLQRLKKMYEMQSSTLRALSFRILFYLFIFFVCGHMFYFSWVYVYLGIELLNRKVKSMFNFLRRRQNWFP